MPGHSQLEMKHIIEAGTDQLEDYEASMDEDGEDVENDFGDGGEKKMILIRTWMDITVFSEE